MHLLYFGSPSCAPCKLTYPAVLALTHLDPALTLDTVDISTEEGMARAEAHGVRSIPAVIAYEGETLRVNISGGERIRTTLRTLLYPPTDDDVPDDF